VCVLEHAQEILCHAGAIVYFTHTHECEIVNLDLKKQFQRFQTSELYYNIMVKALHSELELKLLSRFSSRNEFFLISKV